MVDNKDGLRVYSLNVRSLKTISAKQNELLALKNMLHIDVPNVFCLTETWLNSDVADTELQVNGYNVFRKDRLDGSGGVWYLMLC